MKNHKQIFCGIFMLVLLCVPSCLYYPSSETGATYSMSEKRAADRYDEWCGSLPYYIIPRMCAYYELHPERFKPTGQGEEIEIADFATFIKNDSYFKSGTRCYIIKGTIFDPWGQPLHFVQDLNMDGYIEAIGQRRIVLTVGTTGLNREHHFGICKQSPFKGPFGQPYDRILAVIY
jgi:hypothetical protein